MNDKQRELIRNKIDAPRTPFATEKEFSTATTFYIFLGYCLLFLITIASPAFSAGIITTATVFALISEIRPSWLI